MRISFALILCITLGLAARAQDAPAGATPGDEKIVEYFRQETQKLAAASLTDIKSRQEWTQRRDQYRQQMLDMLGLDPLPERTDLKATVTGTVDHADFTVENLHYQSRPGLYVTANLYVPKGLEGPAPAVLYVCGHGAVKKDGISYGNKVYYQHHAISFARQGYVCLVLDSLQLGEIEGIHHGTYSHGLWWWNSRGYTPAGVEAWNCVRALDYLETRKEVDPKRIAVTGRSGGGAYSWWITAIDDRIAASAPGAGIADLHNHVVDGTVEGHCDCMFMVNTYRWDYAHVAALAAPRPLLLVNTDKDPIFPLDGVMRIYWQVRHLYDLHDAANEFGPDIAEGDHGDFQNQHLAILRWFNKKLKGEDPLIDKAPEKLFEPEQLKVFPPDGLPEDSINARVHETFVPTAPAPTVPASKEAWATQRHAWMQGLRDKSFRGWPEDDQAGSLDVKALDGGDVEGLDVKAYEYTAQGPVRLRFMVASRPGLEKPKAVVLNVLSDEEWTQLRSVIGRGFDPQAKEAGAAPADKDAAQLFRRAIEVSERVFVYMAPRGVGPSAFAPDDRRQTQVRRRFMLLGQTLESMQVWDVRRAVQAVRSLPEMKDLPLRMQGEGPMAGVTLYASLFEPDIMRLDLWKLPPSHMEGPHFLNVLRVLDMPQALAVAAERSEIVLHDMDAAPWSFATETARALDLPEGRIRFEKKD